MENQKQNIVDMMEREQIAVTIETLPEALRRLFDGIGRIYFYTLVKNPIVLSSLRSVEGIDEPENIEKAQELFGVVKEKLNSFSGIVFKFNPSLEVKLGKDGYLSTKKTAEQVLEQAIDYVNLGLKIQNAEAKPIDEYHNIIIRNLKNMKSIMVNTISSITDWQMLYGDAVDVFKTAFGDFNLSVDATRNLISEYRKEKEREALQKSAQGKPTIKYIPEISPAEQERLKTIKQANDLYQELCLDFMRDLEKQYSESTKDMYEIFVNVKFKKFTERFNMPLSNDVSIGQAREAYAQIRNLMNYISKISENAYTISVYGDNH